MFDNETMFFRELLKSLERIRLEIQGIRHVISGIQENDLNSAKKKGK